MALPLDIRDMLSSGAKLRAEREKPIRIAVLVDVQAPDVLIDSMKTALHPQTANAMLQVEVVAPGELLGIDSSADVVIGVSGAGTTLIESLARARQHAIPTVLVGLSGSRDELARRLQSPVLDTLAEEDTEKLIEALGRWLSEKVEGKRIALAANFGFVRRAAAEEAVKSTAFQNAIIGGVAFIPGADMPLMTANQAKMVMQIAAAYGVTLGSERLKEIAGVIGGAFALRTVARQFVGLVPGFGWAIKAGIGYSGTLAMGYAAIEYFESGADLSGLAAKLRSARDRAVEKARARGRRESIPADAWVAGDTALPPAEPALPSEEPLLVPPNTVYESPTPGQTAR